MTRAVCQLNLHTTRIKKIFLIHLLMSTFKNFTFLNELNTWGNSKIPVFLQHHQAWPIIEMKAVFIGSKWTEFCIIKCCEWKDGKNLCRAMIACSFFKGSQSNFCGSSKCLVYTKGWGKGCTNETVKKEVLKAFPGCATYDTFTRPTPFQIRVTALTRSFSIRYKLFSCSGSNTATTAAQKGNKWTVLCNWYMYILLLNNASLRLKMIKNLIRIMRIERSLFALF